MLEKIILKCRYKKELKGTYNWGSLLHGALLEMLPQETGEALHQGNLRPFSQYVVMGTQNELSWHIGLWDEEIAQSLTSVLLHLKSIKIKHKDMNLEVISIEQSKESLPDFFARFFTTLEVCRRYEISFLTPCTHKRNGKYVVFPEVDLIIKSLLQRYGGFIREFSLDDSEMTEQLVLNLDIVRYSLRSAVYYLEGVKITGFMGKITIQIRGPEQLARLAGALLSFGEYAGLGAKTALGMGGVSVKPVFDDRNRQNSRKL
ncbi:MAG: CRISPR-associated endoribonuclease Cas6 [Bacillota bacterium]|jgi:CRISPR-associated endoribonuclease Cas6|nr:CRISPR-associated endoribonuclease Cas6 [Clostridia bacterium]